MFISLSYVCVTIETFIRAMEIHRIRIQKANKRAKRSKNPQSIVQNGQYFLLKLCDYPEPNRFRSLIQGESNGAAFVTLSPLIIATRFKFVLTCWFASCNRNLGVLRQMAPCLCAVNNYIRSFLLLFRCLSCWTVKHSLVRHRFKSETDFIWMKTRSTI